MAMRPFVRSTAAAAAMLGALLGVPGQVLARGGADDPETVMITLRAKPGGPELAAVVARHWETARRLNLVRDEPHVTVRGTESGDTVYFVDIFTWRDAGIPDAAPPEIQAIWTEMNRLVEGRAGRPGLEIAIVELVAPAAKPAMKR
jgi:hypothetical protein